MSKDTVTITNTTKGTLPRVPFVKMKDAILGESYRLSVAIVDLDRSRELNREYRGKDEPTDILSFSLSPDEGELVINLEITEKKAEEHGRTFENFFNFLVIHGLLHLKGLTHGSTMEREETKFRKQFGI